MNKAIPLQSRDYWFKVIEMLQQNWALVDEAAHGVTVSFVSDSSGVFDELKFTSAAEAEQALRLNGFRRYAEDPQAASFLRCPEPPFTARPHPNGPIYSSGRFWKNA
jgi:hypothetical protein